MGCSFAQGGQRRHLWKVSLGWGPEEERESQVANLGSSISSKYKAPGRCLPFYVKNSICADEKDQSERKEWAVQERAAGVRPLSKHWDSSSLTEWAAFAKGSDA